MAIKKISEERLNELESKVSKHKYYITLLCGAYLRRDLSTNEIEYIDDDDTVQNIDQFLLVDMFCLEDWDTEIMNNPEKCWLLEHMHPGKTARQAWRKEVKEYNDSIKEAESTRKQPEPFKYPSIPTKSNESISIIDKPALVEPKHDEAWIHDYKPNW